MSTSRLLSFYVDPETRDITFDGRHQMRMVTDLEARRQRVRLRLSTHTREWFLDVLLGVPWLELVEKGTSKERIRAEVLKALMADDEILRVEELHIGDLGPDRVLRIEFVARLRDGERLADRVEVPL